ncbi:MAG TPA: hypothetical protein O0X73_00315 [Methanocorpusculum sp.]|nr:hypothetical protein [Methanocorpusculum sp.]
MVVPCLTCTALGKYEYTLNQSTDFYEYHIICNHGIVTPNPMPKKGFICKQYENKHSSLPRLSRSNCAIEIRHD